MVECSTCLESPRHPEPELPVTLRPDAHEEAVERDFFPALTSADIGAQDRPTYPEPRNEGSTW